MCIRSLPKEIRWKIVAYEYINLDSTKSIITGQKLLRVSSYNTFYMYYQLAGLQSNWFVKIHIYAYNNIFRLRGGGGGITQEKQSILNLGSTHESHIHTCVKEF